MATHAWVLALSRSDTARQRAILAQRDASARQQKPMLGQGGVKQVMLMLTHWHIHCLPGMPLDSAVMDARHCCTPTASQKVAVLQARRRMPGQQP